MVSERIFQGFRDGSGFFQHGHTYMGHPTACAAALAVQNKIATASLLDNVLKQGKSLDEMLQNRLGNNDNIGDIRGRGLFRGIELVASRVTKEPFDPKLGLHVRIKRQAMDRGLICYPGGGTADGVSGDHVLLAPPFIIEDYQINELVSLLGDAIEAALKEIC
jgi:adenosylmethionine-8-amino-7-oxononanoate aminotransferase